MIDPKYIIAVAGSVDWDQIESKNPNMVSFKNEITGERCNVYFTTMTATIQGGDGVCNTFKDVDLKKLEEILTTER